MFVAFSSHFTENFNRRSTALAFVLIERLLISFAAMEELLVMRKDAWYTDYKAAISEHTKLQVAMITGR